MSPRAETVSNRPILDNNPNRSYYADMQLNLSPEAVAFGQHLTTLRRPGGRRRCSARTIHLYSATADRVLRNYQGDFLRALREIQSPMWHTLYCTALAWMRWKNDLTGARAVQDTFPPPASCRETKSVDRADWKRITEAITTLPEPYRSGLLLITTSGLRINDVFRITYTHANLAQTNHELTIYQKGDRLRDWTPSSDQRKALKALLAFQWRTLQDVFDSRVQDNTLTDTQHYSAAYYQVEKLLRKVCKNVGVEYVRPHRFRHTAATLAMSAGGYSEADVQKLLGHADSRSTSKYYLHSGAKRQEVMKDWLDDFRKGDGEK